MQLTFSFYSILFCANYDPTLFHAADTFIAYCSLMHNTFSNTDSKGVLTVWAHLYFFVIQRKKTFTVWAQLYFFVIEMKKTLTVWAHLYFFVIQRKKTFTVWAQLYFFVIRMKKILVLLRKASLTWQNNICKLKLHHGAVEVHHGGRFRFWNSFVNFYL